MKGLDFARKGPVESRNTSGSCSQRKAGGHPPVDPEVEDAYWRQNYSPRYYVDRKRPYTDYGPAYQYGWESRARLSDRSFADVESDLEEGWSRAKGKSNLPWSQARRATRDAWERVEDLLPADTDDDDSL